MSRWPSTARSSGPAIHTRGRAMLKTSDAKEAMLNSANIEIYKQSIVIGFGKVRHANVMVNFFEFEFGIIHISF